MSRPDFDMEDWFEMPDEIQDALIEWFNQVDMTEEEYDMLHELYERGDFIFYHCGYCDDKVIYGRPHEWSKYQGVSETGIGVGRLCSDCYGELEKLEKLRDE